MNNLKTFYKLDQVGDIPAEDLIRYAIDGHLTLSVNLTAGLLYEPCKPYKELDPLYRPPLLQPDELVTAGKDLLRSDTRIAKIISPADSKPLDIVIDSGNVRSVLESLFVLLPDNQLSKAEFGFKEAVFKNGEEFIRPIGSEDYIFRIPEDGYLVITKANLDAFKAKQAKPMTAPEAPAVTNITTHNAFKKSHYMDSPIKQARAIANNPNDLSEIWGLLLRSAESDTPWPPIIEVAGDLKTIKSYDNSFSKEALRKYLVRNPHAK